MRASDRMTVAVAVAMMLAVFTFRSLTTDRSYVLLSWLLIAVVAAITIGVRRARLPEPAVLAVQLVTVVVGVLALSATMPGAGEPFYQHYTSLWASGIEHMQTQAAPMVPNDGVTIMFVTVVGLIMLLTDLLVSGLGKPVWGIAPPLTLYLVPAVGLGVDTGALSFICIAVGYLGILLAEGLNGTSRWTRGLSRDSADRAGGATPVVWRAAGLIGVPAVIAAMILGQLVPTLSLSGLGVGSGSGSGGQLQLSDPTLDLRRNLQQPPDQIVIRYRSDQPGGLYLRMASLPELNNSGWHNVAMKLTEGEQLPDIPGIGTEPTRTRQTSIQVSNFSSQYLPLPYAPRSFTANGTWAYDANSLVVISNEDGRSRNDAIRGLSYTVRSADVEPSGDDLVGAVAGVPADAAITGVIPSDLPQRFVDLTNEVVEKADAETAAQKAAAIQAYLRSDEFTYSTQPQPGTGYGALERFLFDDKTGYCEQFAGAMAMMARAAGIPSRVAVGFLPGTRNGDQWEVSINDMHAWPELYFAGRGWVRFEPTPAQVTGSAPDWTVATNEQPSQEPSASASSEPSASSRPETQAPSSAPSAAPTTTSGGNGAWLRTGLISLGGVVLLLLLAAPATLRIRRRTHRLSDDGDPADRVEAAWAEIRDSVVDYGGSWPSGSPRSIGENVGKRLDVAESAGMGRVAVLVERSRYAPSVDLDPDADLAAITTDIRKGLAAPRSLLRRVLAVLAPASLFRRSRDLPAKPPRAEKADGELQD